MMKPVPSATRFGACCGPRGEGCGAPCPPGPCGPKKNSNGSTPSMSGPEDVDVMLTTTGFTCSASAATSKVAGTGNGGSGGSVAMGGVLVVLVETAADV